jgi:L-2-hydroxyglutarate oxidase LhgO
LSDNSRLSTPHDFLIIGSGIIGLSIGIALLQSNRKAKVVIYEKESTLGFHASGLNSGVIHAGFYYTPNSLKARFCADGNKELKALCKKNSLPLKEIGKVVVTSNLEEVERLKQLYFRGLENKIDLELLDAKLLPRIEPAARTYEKFLWSPTTAIADPKSVIKCLSLKFKKLGGEIVTSNRIRIIENSGAIKAFIQDKEVRANYIVNAAGVHANQIAKSIGVGGEFACLPFKGIYRVSDRRDSSPKTLIYPVPHPINPFLGVHITLTIDNKIKIGPTAVPLLGREQYSAIERIKFNEMKDSFTAMWALMKGSEYNFQEILKGELPKVFTKFIVKDIVKLVPGIEEVKDWQSLKPGIRAQLVNLETGKLEQDFIVRKYHNSIHVLNAVSPGWTSALPFGRWISNLIFE